jgi:hypothetical protein
MFFLINKKQNKHNFLSEIEIHLESKLNIGPVIWGKTVHYISLQS